MVQQPILQDPSPYLQEPGPNRKVAIAIAVAILIVAVFGWRAIRRFKEAPRAPAVPAAETTVAPAAAKPPVQTAAPRPPAPPAAGVPSAAIPASALEEVAAMEKAGMRVEARAACLAILERFPGAAGMTEVEAKAGALGVELVKQPYPMPEKTDYVVESGDSVDRIAKKFNSTKELLITNNLIKNPNLIKRGDRLRVFSGTFQVRVNKTRNDLLLTLNGRFFKRYRIGTGKFGKTPVGVFVVSDRIAQPVWWKPDGKAVPYGSPENILGTHWLALKPTGDTPPVSGYGIHGTWDDASIGKAESAGCVRMRNADIEELFMLLPAGTEVVIEE